MPCYAHPELKAKIEQAAEGKTLFRCCMFFVSQLYLKSTEEDVANPGAYVPLHSTISQQIYTTRFYGLTTRTLRRIGAIQVLKGGSYEPRKVSKRYRLNPKYAIDVERWDVDCGRYENRLNTALTKTSYEAMSDSARKWIIRSYKAASFSETARVLLETHPFKSKEARICVEHHMENIQQGRLRFMVCPSSRRVYYPVANLPKAFRAEILLAGEPVQELDISASQPTLLATLYPDGCPEKEEYLGFVQGGQLYETIATWAGKGWARDQAKTEFFNQIAFGTFYRREPYELWVPFERRFPKLAGLMADIKRAGNSKLPLQMQALEAKIAIDGACGECAKRKLLVLPVHDSLICRRSESGVIADIFKRNWLAHTDIPARLKVV
jgi:hypothetical protein